MDIQKEREAFVENYRKVYKVDKSLFVNDSGEFTDLFCQDAWVMWQAAKAQAVPEGFVLVPKEPTDKTIARMINTPIEVNLLCDHADIFLSEGEAYIAYQAMIEAQEQAK